MHLTSYIGIGIAIIAIGVMVFIFKSSENNSNNKPYFLSFIALGLMLLNWILYLFDFYAIIPEKIGELIFLSVWIVVSSVGLIAAYKEFRNNRTFSVVNGGLAIISFIIVIPLWLIGDM